MVQEYEAPLQEVISAVGSSYQLPIASTDTLGGIKVGEGLSIDGDGILSLDTSITQTIETHTQQLGGISLAKITQTEYDQLETKDENTLYIITD